MLTHGRLRSLTLPARQESLGFRVIPTPFRSRFEPRFSIQSQFPQRLVLRRRRRRVEGTGLPFCSQPGVLMVNRSLLRELNVSDQELEDEVSKALGSEDLIAHYNTPEQSFSLNDIVKGKIKK